MNRSLLAEGTSSLASSMFLLLETTGASPPPAKEVLHSLAMGWIHGHFRQVVAGVVYDDIIIGFVEVVSGGSVAVHSSLSAEAPEMTATAAAAFVHHECERVVVELSVVS